MVFVHSSSDHHHHHQVINNEEKVHVGAPRNAIPYQSLLRQLGILMKKDHEASGPCDCEETSGTWRSKFELTPYMRHEIWALQRELMLQQMIFKLLQINHVVMSEALNDVQTAAETQAERIRGAAAGLNGDEAWEVRSCHFTEWESGVIDFKQTIDKRIKPTLKEFCLEIANQFLQGDSSSSSSSAGAYDISDFIHIILLKLKDLEMSKPNLIAPVKKQMETLEEMLYFACIIGRKTNNPEKNSENFLLNFQPWVNIAAALVIVYWVDENDEELFALVSPSLENFSLSIPELVEAYLLVIKAMEPSNVSEILLMREIVGRFTDMVLQNLDASDDDRVEMLREGLTLCVAFLMNPPQADAEDEKFICTEINLLVEKAETLIPSICFEKFGEDTYEKRSNFRSDFLEMINKAKADVGKLQLEIPGFSWDNVPETNERGFFDFLLGNLRKKLEAETGLFPFEKHLIAIVYKELSILKPSLMDIFKQQDEHKELKDIWIQASNVAYLVDYVTDSCLSSADIPFWSILMHLSNAIEKIQFVKTEVSKIIQNEPMHAERVISANSNSQLALPAATKDDVKVGFIEEESRIIDCLVAGEAGRDIVAIVGMPGQGKTYLAQRVFQDTRIERHFHRHAWCCISQAYDIKRILLDILENVCDSEPPEKFLYQDEGELADRLRKCLMGRRYLVILDDMWDVKAWKHLESSFPDVNNGSRILITSRNRKVALEAKANCCIVDLHPLSNEDSWSLLQIKVFERDFCPPNLSNVGKRIAEDCKGLPLAIVVVAGLLKKDMNVNSWKQISESLKSHIESEGCMNILDLSYKHLPDYLRPCFLYLGTFREDETIDAKWLIQFWIAEGFVQNDENKSMEVVANEYLIELVARSLVFVAQRSSRNGIKKCLVHDLLHQLCLIKAEEEKFLLFPNVSDHHSSSGRSSSSSSTRFDHYRLCFHDKWGPSLDSIDIAPNVRSLLVSLSRFDPSSNAPGFLKRFRHLRVLDLSYVLVTQADFHEITQFIHLRLLALRFKSVSCGFLIPSSIVNLFRLEVLCFQCVGRSVTLPSSVIRMENLRHIFTSRCSIEYIEDFDKMDLPDNSSSSPMTNLETFTSFYFGNKLAFQGVAQRLPNILKLGVTLTFCVRLSSYFKKLESLSLCILRLPQETEVISSPSALDFPSTLKKLNLTTQLTLSSAVISSIGKLDNLEALKLRANFEDDKWDVEDDEFLRLKYFEFRLSSIQEWKASDESFPCLEQLIVKKCRKLVEIPERFGTIVTLKRIEVRSCSGTVSASFHRVVVDQWDLGNGGLQSSMS